MPEADGRSSTAGEGRRVEELLRVNGELAAELRALQAKRTSGPRSAAMPAARRVGKLSEERDSLAAELEASRAELEALKQHTDGLAEKVGDQARAIDELSHEVTRLRGGLAGALRRLSARLSRSPRSAR